MPAERLTYRALYTEATNSWVKPRGGQATTWLRNMKTLTAPLSKVGRYRLPGWDPRDHSNRWLDTLSEMAVCRDTSADSPLLQETASTTKDPRISPDDVTITNIPIQLDSPVLASCASLVLKTTSFVHLLCLLFEPDELVLYLISSDHAYSEIIWRKRIATHSARMLRLITHPDPRCTDGNAGLILAQQFHMTESPVISLFLFNCPTSTPFSAIQLLDVTVTSLPPCPLTSCSDTAHVASHRNYITSHSVGGDLISPSIGLSHAGDRQISRFEALNNVRDRMVIARLDRTNGRGRAGEIRQTARSEAWFFQHLEEHLDTMLEYGQGQHWVDGGQHEQPDEPSRKEIGQTDEE
ncbi:uncharacterized protein DEA37_0001280 [Paragonimus westermani]|uniref:Uncharacterized protein n=1 Tax=Paragonimus westermani TaxID=34504 RepID=A0A5J4P376_9TREM|nr:uncharacterized protein DEA37_0001280 [Paragonimus westermani]